MRARRKELLWRIQDRIEDRLPDGAWLGLKVGGMFVCDPVGTIALAFLLKLVYRVGSLGQADPRREKWLREKEREADRAHKWRRRRGVLRDESELLLSEEMSAAREELKERRGQGLYPYGPPEPKENGDGS